MFRLKKKHWPKRVLVAQAYRGQCFIFSLNIGSVTTKSVYFNHLNNRFLDQIIQQLIRFHFKKEALIVDNGLDTRSSFLRL